MFRIVESVGNVYAVPFKTNATCEPDTPRELFAAAGRPGLNLPAADKQDLAAFLKTL